MESQTWFDDSGASHHITFDLSSLKYIKSCVGPNKVVIINGNSLEVKTIGDYKF